MPILHDQYSEKNIDASPASSGIAKLAPQKRAFLTMPMAVVIAGALVGGAIIAVGWHAQSSAGTASANAVQPPAQAADVSKVHTAGEAFIGKPNAPVTIAYWYDYQCPFCKMGEENALPQVVKKYVDTGKVKIIFKDFSFLGADSSTIGQYARAVWAIAPDRFYEWHKAIFTDQGSENSGWATADNIRSITATVLGAAAADKAVELVKKNGALYQKELDTDRAEGMSFGITGTPAFIIDTVIISGAQPYGVFEAAIDGALATKK